ncbi:DUF1109 domain-containing protein [Thalassotalea sp. HSM 43]|uniref:NrsF family protein n=1 Tax=Thalassotalea sp. HSM 43 TaxID=2552945 RepID=UPI001081DD9A|nr:NrsF family protein [Thalassotalea sp. HSM 43]QBY03265.1 DUF1109 domain-containing protein [Thalassotalea sp. HSM 43]
MPNRDKFIADLTDNLEPVKPMLNIDALAMIWCVISVLYVIAIIHLTGPTRPGALSQLVTEPRFLLETLLGLTAIICLSLLAFRDAVPGALSSTFMKIGIVLVMVWLAQYAIGLLSPALQPSDLGKRPMCLYETMMYSLPPIYAAWYLARRYYPLQPVRTAMMLSLSAGLMPALYMQIACMYEPKHILSFHIMPGVLMALFGIALAWFWQRDKAK